MEAKVDKATWSTEEKEFLAGEDFSDVIKDLHFSFFKEKVIHFKINLLGISFCKTLWMSMQIRLSQQFYRGFRDSVKKII